MKLPAGTVQQLVNEAYQSARVREVATRRPSGMAYMRSRAFIAALAEQFRRVYPVTAGYCVFAGRDQTNRAAFGREEFMGDVSVCEVDVIPAGRRGAGNAYVKRALWMVESEFDPAPKAALADFIKFVAGAADQKLFVAPVTPRAEGVLEPLAYPARHCSGEVYAALVPHPRGWPGAADRVQVWHWDREQWVCVPDPAPAG